MWLVMFSVAHGLSSCISQHVSHSALGQERLGPVLLAASEVKAGAWVKTRSVTVAFRENNVNKHCPFQLSLFDVES